MNEGKQATLSEILKVFQKDWNRTAEFNVAIEGIIAYRLNLKNTWVEIQIVCHHKPFYKLMKVRELLDFISSDELGYIKYRIFSKDGGDLVSPGMYYKSSNVQLN